VRSSFILTASAVFLAGCQIVGSVDSTTIIADEPVCSACRITATAVGNLGTLDGPDAFEAIPAYAISGDDGRIWTTGGEIPREFRSDGSFVRMIGRSGTGPGEFQMAAYPVPLPGDSIMVVSRHIAAIFGPDGAFVRQIVGLQGRTPVIVQWPDTVIETATVRGEPSGLRSISMNTDFASEHHVAAPAESRRPAFGEIYTLVGQSQGNVFAARLGEYRIDQWSRQLSLVRQYRRDAKWWTPYTRDPSLPHGSVVQAVTIDETGLMWVALRVAGKDWQTASGRQVDASGHTDGGDPTRYFASRVEVLDLVRGQLLAWTDVDAFVVALLPGPVAAVAVTGNQGEPQLQLLKLKLERSQVP
jgi:hypothetical protein